MLGEGPLVSVVLPTYNSAGTLLEAVGSVLAQDFEQFELIVVDDGSSDDTLEVLASVRDSKLLVVTQPHKGIVAALNNGCGRARGKYVARLDADDAAYPSRLREQYQFLENHPEVGLVGTWAEFQLGGATRVFAPPTADKTLRRVMLWDNPFVHSSVMFRLETFKSCGGYRNVVFEDYDLWVRMALHCKIAVIPVVLVKHKIHGSSLSRRIRRWESLRERLQIQYRAATTIGQVSVSIPLLVLATLNCGLAYVGSRVAIPDRLKTSLKRRMRCLRRRAMNAQLHSRRY